MENHSHHVLLPWIHGKKWLIQANTVGKAQVLEVKKISFIKLGAVEDKHLQEY